MAKRGGLGRGLDALIPDKSTDKGKNKSKSSEQKQAVKSGAETKSKSSGTKASTKSTASASSGTKRTAARPKGTANIATADEKISPKKPADSKKQDAKEQHAEDAAVKKPVTENKKEEAVAAKAEDLYFDEQVSVLQTGSEEQDEDAVRPELADADTGDAKNKASVTPADAIVSNEAQQDDEAVSLDHVVQLPIDKVLPNRDQPRHFFDEDAIRELSDSIRQFGIIQPLLVQKQGDLYQIIAGERRWRAAGLAGLTEVPVIIRDFSDQEAVEVALIENIQREDLNPIEEARAYQRLVTEYSLSQEEVAGRVSKSRSAVTNSMRLLKLDVQIQGMVETGQLSEGHARTLLPLPDYEIQKTLADRIISEKLSVRQTEKLVRELLTHTGAERKEKKLSANAELLNTLSDNLGAVLHAKVLITQKSRHRGKIEIDFSSDEELDRIYALLRSIQ